MKKKDAFVIFSVFQTRLSKDENLENHKKVLRHLKDFGLKFKVVEGVYRGESELSILVPVINQVFDLSTVEQLAHIYDQQCILFVDSDRNAELRFMVKSFDASLNQVKSEKLGKFIATTKGIATQCENYTKDGNDYYICDLRHIA
jgi:hypothetical protein|tara:strand:+ start:66 stop:500 length:435 start_codon:yes stop_codon:yes gene_type:complete